MVSLTQLAVLSKVVEAGGFSEAAKSLFMSQPAISNHIRNLERSMGVRLVHRSGTGARPTPAGEVAVAHARRVTEALDTVEQAMAEFRELRDSTLTVAGTPSLGARLLPGLIADFSARAPTVKCQIRVGGQEQVMSWLLLDDAALGLCVAPPSSEQLAHQRLFDEQMLLVAAPGTFPPGRRLSPSDVAGHRFLLRERDSTPRRLQDRALDLWGLSTVERWEMWGTQTLLEAATRGLGLTLLPEDTVRAPITSGRLVALRISPAPPVRTVYLARRAGRAPSPPDAAFAALLNTLTDAPRSLTHT
ncbi:LysR family transcriptional regulator [Streptomyces parvus]|uniref:LysR family transcriptional regulator n=1 Tax=Streptomyces parvus TaxID=66428 RepID=UPI0034365E8C